jgi:hypothetical protein
MNDNVLELLKKYSAEFIKMNVPAKRCEDYSGEIGLRRLEDEQIQLRHARWMVDEMLDEADQWSDRKVNRWLGFIQGILWCVKFRGILELRDESRNLYDG